MRQFNYRASILHRDAFLNEVRARRISQIGDRPQLLECDSSSVRRESLAPPEKEKEDRHDQEDHDSSGPQKPSTFTAISADDHATRRQEEDE